MKPIKILKKGLTKLQNQIEDQKTRLEGKLRACQPILDSDQEWLDNDGNLMDEEQVVDALDHASNYKQGLERLNSHDRAVVDKLQSLAGSCAPSKKCKHMAFLNLLMMYTKSICRS